jgi:hypothetical protein
MESFQRPTTQDVYEDNDCHGNELKTVKEWMLCISPRLFLNDVVPIHKSQRHNAPKNQDQVKLYLIIYSLFPLVHGKCSLWKVLEVDIECTEAFYCINEILFMYYGGYTTVIQIYRGIVTLKGENRTLKRKFAIKPICEPAVILIK